MGVGNKSLFISCLIILIILIIIIVFIINKQKMVLVEIDLQKNLTDVEKTLCPSSQKIEGQLKYKDKLQTITTYLNNITTYFISSEVHNVEGASLSTSTWSNSVSLECGKIYTPIALTSLDIATSAIGEQFKAEGVQAQHILEGKKIRQLEIRIKDTISDSYLNITNSISSSNLIYQQLDNNLTNATNSAGYSGLVINEDDYIDVDILVKTNETNTIFGEDDLNTYLCIDVDKNYWDEPLISIGLLSKQNILNDLDANDARALTGFEYCYNIGQITHTSRTINYYQETDTNKNPSTESSPILYFIAEGRYLSNKEVDFKGDKIIKVGAFQDDISFTPVATANKQKIQLVIS